MIANPTLIHQKPNELNSRNCKAIVQPSSMSKTNTAWSGILALLDIQSILLTLYNNEDILIVLI